MTKIMYIMATLDSISHDRKKCGISAQRSCGRLAVHVIILSCPGMHPYLTN